jgi:hypothetical protein
MLRTLLAAATSFGVGVCLALLAVAAAWSWPGERLE